MRPVPIAGAAAVSSHGLSWKGLGHALLHHDLTPSREPIAIPPADDVDPRLKKTMSPGARLAAIATRRALADAGWGDGRDEIGFYLGVGASGGSMDELGAMLRASVEREALSLPRFGDHGLRACNPLFAFQLMNNFTLAHAAIVEGIGGPNAAFFSRGTGTIAAIAEAAHAVSSGECARALAGGADSAFHPVTRAELARDGFDLVPAEGAALLALGEGEPKGWLVDAAFASGRDGAANALRALLADHPVRSPLVMIAGWKPDVAMPLRGAASSLGANKIVDVTAWMGHPLAASPAIAAVAALDLARSFTVPAVVPVLTWGVDGDVGLIVVSKEQP